MIKFKQLNALVALVVFKKQLKKRDIGLPSRFLFENGMPRNLQLFLAASFNVPYEDMPYVSVGKNVEIILPDKERLTGTVSSPMLMMDSVSQTQTFAVKANVSHNIPQNLVATIRIVKVTKTTAATLPKNSVLSNETQSEFWVMKMINDTIAVKIPVKKGLEISSKVEIVSPEFSPKDKILLSGNYGLPDTALVIVNK